MASTFDIASQNNSGVLNSNSSEASISADGNLVAFNSYDSISGKYQIYVKNKQTSALTLVSQSTNGIASNGTDYYPTISADGSTVGFDSVASNLVAGATTGNDEVYVKNLQTNGLVLVSQTANATVADNVSEYAALSANGNIVAFDSNATNLGLGASGAVREIYVKNISTGTLTLASQTSNGTIGDGQSYSNSISADGNVVVFESTSTDLGSSSGADEIYAKNIASGALTIASETSGGIIANGASDNGSVSADGNFVVFQSTATNLVAGATSGNYETYLKNLQTGALTLVSSTASGTIANGSNYTPIISADGQYAMFTSTATNLVAGATSGTAQVYVKNLQTGGLSLLSQDGTGTAGNSGSQTDYPSEEAFSANDATTVFSTDATNLAGTPAGAQVVLRDTTSGPSLTFKPVTSDDIINATELAAPVTFSGTSDAIGGTVQVSLDTAGNSIGSATVQSDGSWSVTANVSSLSQGSHTEIATAQGTAYLSTVANQTFTVNTTAPTVAFTPGVTFTNAHTATLNGTVSDPSSTVTSVQISDNGTNLGNATLNGDGTWTLANATVGSGVQNLTATATDAAGNVSQPTAPLFSLQTGIRGQPYSADEEDFDSQGNLTGETFTKRGGAVYLADTVTNLANGDHRIDYSAGTYFNTRDFYYQSDLYSPDYGVVKTETLYNDDGTHSVTGFTNGQHLTSVHDDTMTGGGRRETFVFEPHFGQDLITDFIAGGPGHDILNLPSAQFSSVSQVLNHTQDVHGGAEIKVGPHETITLQNVTKAELQAHRNDFTFHA